MYPDDLIPLAIDTVKRHFPGNDYQLEEFKTYDDGDVDVTVSYRPPTGPGELFRLSSGSFSPMRAALGIDSSRMYKDVRISPDGKIKSVRIRAIVVG